MKKRNPQDATLRNTRALQKRVKRLEQQMRYISIAVGMLSKLTK